MSFPRYPRYKPTGVEWLPEVPAHWEVWPTKRLLRLENGADYKLIEAQSGVPVIGSGGTFAWATRCMFNGESVLFGRKGTIDRPLYINGPFWTVDTMYWSRIAEGASARFCWYAAMTIPFALYATSTALPSMTKGDLESHPQAVPPLAEQRAIAAFLDRETKKIDELVAEQERLIELLKEKRQAVISHAVTKGPNPAAPMKPSGVEWLGEVPEHWEVKRLKRILLRNDGGVWGADPVDEADPIVLRSTEQTVDGNWNIQDPARRRLSRDEFVSAQLFAGDLLVTKSSGSELHIGKSTLVTPAIAAMRCCYSNFMQRLRFSEFLLPELGWYFLNCRVARAQLGFLSNTTTGLANLNAEVLGLVQMSLPPLAEQRAIAAFLDRQTKKIDTLVTQAESAISLLTERRSALISAAVTGQIDVRNAVPSANPTEAA
jgi:type I restriction enzyme S subunit